MSRIAQHGSLRPALRFASVCVLLLGGVGGARAQQDIVLPPLPAPPPMKYIPEAVRGQLSAARDAKARTRLSIEVAEQRLVNAEGYTAAQQFDAAAAELGVYQALAADALRHLQQLGKNDGKTRDLFKLLELALFRHSGRIEAMRRSTPSEYASNVRAALNHTRETRTAALNAFYGNTVLREEQSGQTKPAQKPAKPDQPNNQQ
jgi:hypothetical protein